MTRLPPTLKKAETDPHKFDIAALAKRTLAYALRRGRWLAWRSGNARLATIAVAEDAAAEAMASLFGAAQGSRKWNPETIPDPGAYLVSAVNSILWGLTISSEEKARPLGARAERVTDADNPETLAMAAEQQRWQQQFEEQFLEGVLADPELTSLYTAMEEMETDKPAQLAKRLKLTAREVDSRKRRLRTLGSKILAAMTQELDGEDVK